MTIEEKAITLQERHIKLMIEWGGTDLFTSFSDLSTEATIQLLFLIKTCKNSKRFNDTLTHIIQEEHERQR